MIVFYILIHLNSVIEINRSFMLKYVIKLIPEYKINTIEHGVGLKILDITT